MLSPEKSVVLTIFCHLLVSGLASLFASRATASRAASVRGFFGCQDDDKHNQLTATPGAASVRGDLGKTPAVVGRKLQSLYTLQAFWPFFRGQSHGHMAPLLRSRKKLVCFYCNKKSGVRYDGVIRKWYCSQCESTNFLDENGEITDPPVATNIAAPKNLTFAISRPYSPPPVEDSESELFCATCLKNQHLFTASLAQYDVELDPRHPNFRQREREYYKYRKNLERTYPQVCGNCEPQVLAKMKEAGKTAKADHLRRLMDKTRERRTIKTRQVSLSAIIDFFGKFLWYTGFLGQLLWHVISLTVYAQHGASLPPQPIFSPMPGFLELVSAASIAGTWPRISLYMSIASLWWNPMFKQMNRGFTNHIYGFGNWYRLQILMVVSRSIFIYILGTRDIKDLLSAPSAGAHTFMLVFNTILMMKSHWSLKVDHTPLWTSTPEKLSNVGPTSSSPVQAGESMADILHSIAASPSRKPKTQDGSTSPWSQPLEGSDQSLLNPKYDTPTHRHPFSSHEETMPSRIGVSANQTLHYAGRGAQPSDTPQSDDFEVMDWTPAKPESDVKPQSEHRAFRPVSSAERSTQLFGQSPIGDQSSPFWYKVPAAPTTPAQRLRNPPNPPTFRAPSQEVKVNFFNSVSHRPSNSRLNGKSASQSHEMVDQGMELSQQRFFAPAPPSEAGNNLADLLTSFSLGTSDTEALNSIEDQSRLRHACQALILLLGIFPWAYVTLNPTEHSRNVMFAIMTVCALISVRSVYDSGVLSKLGRQKGMLPGILAVLGCLECAAALYQIVQILAQPVVQPVVQPVRYESSDSYGAGLLGVMLLHQVWMTCFGS